MKTSDTQLYVTEVFEKHNLAQPLFDAVHKGFNQYLINDSQRAHIHNNTVIAGLINSYIAHENLLLLSSQKFPMRFNMKGNSKTIIIADRIISRVKKIGQRGITENVITETVKSFRGHDTNKILKSATKLIPVDVAYDVDPFHRSITGVYLLCPNEDKNLWVTPFYVIGAQQSALFTFDHYINVQPAPLPFAAPAESQQNEIERVAKMKLKAGIGKKEAK